MLTFYCPHCWALLTEEQRTCPNCGYILDGVKESDFEDKLLAACSHAVPKRRIMAAQILGIRESRRALPEFLKIITSSETNYFFIRAVLLATVKINHPGRESILQKATQHRSALVAQPTRELLDEFERGQRPDRGDRHTG